MKTATTTLRLEILREAIEQYKAIQKGQLATEHEKMLASLKQMECEEMIRELMEGPR
jgi:hypothetical protein